MKSQDTEICWKFEKLPLTTKPSQKKENQVFYSFKYSFLISKEFKPF